jgi:hypothetical protein
VTADGGGGGEASGLEPFGDCPRGFITNRDLSLVR